MRPVVISLLVLVLALSARAGESATAAIAALRQEIAAERAAIAAEQGAIDEQRTAARRSLAELRERSARAQAAHTEAEAQLAAVQAEAATWAATQAARRQEAAAAYAILEARDQSASLVELGAGPPTPLGKWPADERVPAQYEFLLAHAGTLERGEFRIFDAAGEQRTVTGLRLGWIGGVAQVDGGWQLLYTPTDGVQPRGYVSALATDPAGGHLTLDVSGGLARQQPVAAGWQERLRAGGMVTWPLLAIAVLALLMVLERTVAYARVRWRSARLEEDLPPLLRAGDFAAVTARLDASDGPMQRVWRRGLHLVRERHTNLEEAMQEAVLSEIPPLERFLSALAVFAAVAPLLGLLGTVSGMIKTFDAISRFGGGDATVLSGGISEALVSTWFGLCVAIPILLAHAVLVRQARLLVGRLDQAALLILESAGHQNSDADGGEA